MDLAKAIFKKEKTFSWEAKYDHKPLEDSLKRVISDPESPLGLDEDALLICEKCHCKTFVVATSLKNDSPKPILLRAYHLQGYEEEPFDTRPLKIWEAGRITSAAPT